ncbi:MAG: glycosyltransferase family 2 protein [Actinomycetota bacterium]
MEFIEPNSASSNESSHNRSALHRTNVHPNLSIIVPVRNEADTLLDLFEAIVDAVRAHTFEVIFIDDGSTDDSVDVLYPMAARDARIRIVRLRSGFGKAAALATGFREARGDVIVTMDADLQDDPHEIEGLTGVLSEGFDVVSGWKRDRKDPWSRRASSKVFNWAARRVTGLTLHDFNCGLKVYRAEAAREIADSCYGEMHRFLPAIAAWNGLRVTERIVHHQPRLHGRSRYGIERYSRALVDFTTAAFLGRFRRRPMHLLGSIALIAAASGVAVEIGAGLSFAFGIRVAPPVLAVSGGVLAVVAMQAMFAGLIAEAVARPIAREPVPFERIVVLPEVRLEEHRVGLIDELRNGNGHAHV